MTREGKRQRLLLSGSETVSGVTEIEREREVCFVLFCSGNAEEGREERWHCGSGVGTWERKGVVGHVTWA